MVVEIGSVAEGNDLRGCFLHGEAQRILAHPPRASGHQRIQLAPATTPLDPFRWNQLCELVGDSEHILIIKRDLTDFIPNHELWENGQMVRRFTNIRLMDTDPVNPNNIGGLTIPGRWVTDPSRRNGYVRFSRMGSGPYSGLVGMAGAPTTVIYRPIRGFLSLAHEFFGHAYLLHMGLAYRHGTQMAPLWPAPTPYVGHPFYGSVNNYLETVIGDSASPTQFVSTVYLTNALSDFQRLFSGASFPIGDYNSIPGLVQAWRILSVNFCMLQHLGTQVSPLALVRLRTGSVPTPTVDLHFASAGPRHPTGAEYLIQLLVTFHNNLRGVQQTEFRRFVHHFRTTALPGDPFAARANLLSDTLMPFIPAA